MDEGCLLAWTVDCVGNFVIVIITMVNFHHLISVHFASATVKNGAMYELDLNRFVQLLLVVVGASVFNSRESTAAMQR